MSMVDYVRQRYTADPDRIFATGTSSGAMMTNVLLGDYPDVFAAGASFAGVPFGCFATGGTARSGTASAPTGSSSRTAQQWGDLVRKAYPGYTGPRPRMQIWHGTNDETLRYPNFGEEVKQWTNVHGLSQTPTYTDTPQSGYTRTRYGGSGADGAGRGDQHAGCHAQPAGRRRAGDPLLRAGRHRRRRRTPPPTTPPPTTPPPTTPPPTTPPPTTPPPTEGACRVGYTVNAWNTGLTASVAITNTGTTAVNGWALAFTLPTGQTITSGWNAPYTPTSGAVTARNVSYNGTIAPNASVEIGFQATHAGGTGKPTSFALNGAACSVS